MLVLSRRLNEKIVVLDPVTNREILSVTVTGLEYGRVRLGFETAGTTLPIYREEVLERYRGPAKPLAK